jgi:hypothetical protein
MRPANATRPQRKERRRDGPIKPEDDAKAAADPQQMAAAPEIDAEEMADQLSP